MYTKQELEAMTVLQLRKVAKECAVKLGAGIDKAGIVDKICRGTNASLPEKATVKESSPMNSSLSFDVTSAPKGPYIPRKAPKTDTAKVAPASNRQADAAPVTRPVMPVKPLFRPTQPLGGQKRFGPQNRTVSEDTDRTLNPQNKEAETKPKEQLVTADGFRLGYRAQSQRNSFNREGSQESRGRYPYQKRTAAPTPAENHFHDDLYQMARNVEFDRQAQNGELPDLLQCGTGESVSGKLEILPEGYGFLRDCEKNVYISQAQIKRFGLRSDDVLEGKALQIKPEDPYPVMLYVEKLNDKDVESGENKTTFEQLEAVYPTKRIPLDAGATKNSFIRLVDLMAPMGFGQRSLIIAPPESGSLQVLRDMCKAIRKNDPEAEIFMLLIDVPAEEVTEMKKAVKAEIFSSPFGETPEAQTRVSEALLERAQHAAADGKNAVIMLDSMNKLVRAYQNQIAQGNRPITNTVTPSALIRPKRLFGMAKNTETAGSLTVISVLQIETGSRIDDIIYEEFKGTANMVLTLCAPKPDDPVFPMINLEKSGTRREDLILNDSEKENLKLINTMLMGETNENSVAQLLDMIQKTKSNHDLFSRLKGWMAILGK